jgi:hypothetical protein
VGRAPGYPAFLALLDVRSPVDEVPIRVKVAQAVVGVCGILFIAAIAGGAGGDRAAIAAAVIAAVYPPLVWMPSYALSETLYSTLALAVAWVLTRTSLKACATAAILTAAALIVRPAMLFFVPFATIWLAFRREARNVLVFLAVIACCMLPWTIRNHHTYGRWVLVASEGGVTFWTGNHALSVGEGDLAANPALKEAEIAFRRAHASTPPENLEPLYYRAAFEWIRANPGAWLTLEARKLFFTIVPIGPSYAVHSPRYRMASAGSYLVLLPFAVAGIWRLRLRPAAATPLWLMAAATVISGLVFFPQERFRIPVIDPALIVSAAALAGLRINERISRRPYV